MLLDGYMHCNRTSVIMREIYDVNDHPQSLVPTSFTSPEIRLVKASNQSAGQLTAILKTSQSRSEASLSISNRAQLSPSVALA